jgi:glycosyltransferase involved in cell wall biosynthesis
MNVLFDASWLAIYTPGTYMHGGLRVTYEMAKRLAISKLVNTDFTLTYLNMPHYEQLQRFISREFQVPNDRVVINNSFPVQGYYKFSKLLQTQKGGSFMMHHYNFLELGQIKKFNIYHSPVEAIPDIIKKEKKIKPFLTALDLIALVKPQLAYSGFREQLYHIYQSIDANTTVLAISQSTKNDLLNYRKDIKEENVIVTYIAANTDIFYPDSGNDERAINVLSNYGVEKGNYFFTLSALAKFKNTKHTINCFLKYAAEFNNKTIKLLLVGRTREANYDTDIFAQYKSHPQIVFRDFIPEEELSIMYSNATAFLYMSLYEGFGLPILEAMQCGTAVICSNTSSMPEVVGNAGICIDPDDEDLLCDSMHIMVNDDEKRKSYCELGLERSKLFSWEKHTNDVINAYKRFY